MAGGDGRWRRTLRGRRAPLLWTGAGGVYSWRRRDFKAEILGRTSDSGRRVASGDRAWYDPGSPVRSCATMPIHVNCPTCQAAYVLNDNLAGKTVRCAACKAVVQIPKAPPADA